MRDELFKTPNHKRFEFNEEVVSVFDDMLLRSIPFYEENLKLCVKFISLYAREGGRIYDIGCSQGNTLFALTPHTKSKLIGIDNSKAMIAQARLRARALNIEKSDIEFVERDCLTYEFLPCEVVNCSYTLQFIPPSLRGELLQKIYASLQLGGVFVMSEKLRGGDELFDEQMIEIYYAFKESNGYSKTQIALKREALEDVLIPFSMQENIKLLQDSGFGSVEVIFRYNNFASFIARKD